MILRLLSRKSHQDSRRFKSRKMQKNRLPAARFSEANLLNVYNAHLYTLQSLEIETAIEIYLNTRNFMLGRYTCGSDKIQQTRYIFINVQPNFSILNLKYS